MAAWIAGAAALGTLVDGMLHRLRLHPAARVAIAMPVTQDLYTWGGQLRETDTGPGGTGIAHARPEFIDR